MKNLYIVTLCCIHGGSGRCGGLYSGGGICSSIKLLSIFCDWSIHANLSIVSHWNIVKIFDCSKSGWFPKYCQNVIQAECFALL